MNSTHIPDHDDERIVRAFQVDIYRLAPRMLCNREDAEDAPRRFWSALFTRASAIQAWEWFGGESGPIATFRISANSTSPVLRPNTSVPGQIVTVLNKASA